MTIYAHAICPVFSEHHTFINNHKDVYVVKFVHVIHSFSYLLNKIIRAALWENGAKCICVKCRHRLAFAVLTS